MATLLTVSFAQVIPNLQGWDVRGRDALHRGRPPKDIVIHTKVNADKENLTLGITAEVEGREVSIKDLLASASRGQNVMIFKDGMRARINDEWLARYRTLVEFGGRRKGQHHQGKGEASRSSPRRWPC